MANIDDDVRIEYPGMTFGVALAEGVNFECLEREIASGEPDAQRDATGPGAQENAFRFQKFFKSAGHDCPIPRQLKQFSRKGLPPAPTPIRALLLVEGQTGILMGVQDGAKTHGRVALGLAAADEQFEGMHGVIRCGAGELVVRDELGPVASYFQGPDSRTAITPSTTALLFYVFDTPDTATAVEDGLVAIELLLSDCAETFQSEIVGITAQSEPADG
jgi:hypothetical protein